MLTTTAIITYGPVPLSDLVNHESIQILERDPTVFLPTTSIRIVDHLGVVFHLSLDKCGTFFVSTGPIFQMMEIPQA
jgi:hypothetical protein